MNAVYKQSRLNQLLKERVHGATNIAGIRFQLMYSVSRAFDLYGPDAPEAIHLEAIEDLDVRGNKQWEIKKLIISNQFVQVKTSKVPWEWGKFNSSGIVQNFLPVWTADSEAELLVVTNFSYKAGLDEFAKFCNGKHSTLSKKVKTKLREMCTKAGYPTIDPDQLGKRIRFSRVTEEDLSAQVERLIVKYFNLATPNADLYFSALMGRFLTLAEQRKEVRRQDLERLRLSIQEQIELGVQNAAVQNRWLERLEFAYDAHPEDYYEGKNARPGHVLAGMDVARHEWIERIKAVLERSKVCVVRSSSGQGKSTLLFRYAYEHYHPETTFIIRQVSDEMMIGPIRQALAAWQPLGLPLMVLIDNVSVNLKYWSQIAAEFAGQEVRFLVSIREEDWFRYSGNLSGFDWEIVTPTLSLTEARSIYHTFKQQGKTAANVPSAEWAYERIAKRKLLIEFTYLITHGQMLEERLREQVQEIDRSGEDPAKLQVLRLVSVAQLYGARITNESLLQCVKFQRDPDMTLQSLEGEYIFQHEGTFEGLHYIRSQHLVSLLHVVTPLEKTTSTLIEHLDPENLEQLVSAAFTDPDVHHDQLLALLVKRCLHEPFAFSNRMVMSLFTASELMYYRLHRQVFDRAFEEVGSAAFMLLCSETLPFPRNINLLETVQNIAGESMPRVNALVAFREQFTPRQWEDRYETVLLRHLIEQMDQTILREDLSQISAFLDWCRLTRVDPSRIVAFLAEHDWREQIYGAQLEAAAALLHALYTYAPHAYEELMKTDKTALLSYFKLASDTIELKEEAGDISIEFIVGDQERHVDQAVNRLRNLRKFFPTYQHYCSNGLFPSLLGTELNFPNDTHKCLASDTLELESDAEKNGAYFRAVKSEYAAESMFDWQKQWFHIRSELLNIVKACLILYETLCHQKVPELDTLTSIMNTALYRLSHIREFPPAFSERFKQEQLELQEWSANMSNFIEQFAGHSLKDANQQMSLLMRFNLKEAIKNLPKAQRALHRIIDATHPYYPFGDLDEEERTEYDALSAVIDFWFERSSAQTHDMRKAALANRQNKRIQFAEALRTTLKPLEADSFRFAFPTGPLEDHPSISICLGFEIESYETQPLQVMKIVAQLTEFSPEYHFLCNCSTPRGS